MKIARSLLPLGLLLAATTARAVPPPPITNAEMESLHAAAASMAPKVEAAAAELRENVARDVAQSNAASKAAAAFLLTVGVSPAMPDVAPVSKPPEFKPGPDDTVISCDGGMYFDPDEGVLVYLKNVTVKDPRFSLRGANELKIFLAKKAAPDPVGDGSSPDKATKGFAASFGDPERIVASGAIVIEQKPTDGKDPIKASAALFSYNIKEDQIVLSGGYPWFTQGAQGLHAKAANQSVRISPKSGELRTDGGGWETLLVAPKKNP